MSAEDLPEPTELGKEMAKRFGQAEAMANAFRPGNTTPDVVHKELIEENADKPKVTIMPEHPVRQWVRRLLKK